MKFECPVCGKELNQIRSTTYSSFHFDDKMEDGFYWETDPYEQSVMYECTECEADVTDEFAKFMGFI